MAAVPAPLAIFGELRTQFKSIKDRYKKYKEGPHKFQSLTDKLDVLVRHLDDMESLLRMFPDALPSAGATLFQENLARLGDSFKEENAVPPPRLVSAFVGSSSSTMPRRVLRAKSLDEEMTALQNKIDPAMNQLQHLLTVLLTALKVDENVASKAEIEENHNEVMSMLYKVIEHGTPRAVSQAYQDALVTMLHKLNENIMHLAQSNREEFMSQLTNMTETSHEAYRPASNAPDLGRTVVRDFSPATALGKLKQKVLYGGSSEIVTAATGAIEPTETGTTDLTYGVLGMAGVGKTVALQALGHDEEVRKRFRHGVLYMTFGREANMQTAIGQIAKIMTLTGATTKVQNVRSSTSLQDAVDYAVMWFGGKVCLYLIDDLWPAQYLPSGYFLELRQLLRGSPDSKMAISTRSHTLALEADCAVEFSPRVTLGKASLDIFMAHACHSTLRNSPLTSHDLRNSVRTILSKCSGLPIALSVAGCAVLELVGVYGTFENACDEYAEELVEKTERVGSSLNAGILLSLKFLEVEFSNVKNENSLQIDHSMLDMYTSLCVLSNQAWVPVSVLSRLWNLNKRAALKVANLFRKMSLAKLETPPTSGSSREEPRLALHDLHLEFCQQQAEASNKSSFWHTQLLNGYRNTTNQPIAEEPKTQAVSTILSYVPRPWWSHAVPEDGYIHANLARHLLGAGQGVELAALMLDAQWTLMRARIGGMVSLNSDFAHLGRYLSQWNASGEVQPSIRQVKQSFENIFKAVRLSWGRLQEGIRAFQFHVCGCLQSSREPNGTVDDYLKEPKSLEDAYLKSVVMTTPKPYLVPVRAFLPGVSSALMMEIRIGDKCNSVSCSPCGRYIVAGAGLEIVIVNASTGEELQRMYGHSGNVSCVKFAGGSKKIVSVAKDRMVMVWEWESSSLPVQFLQSNYPISGLAVHINAFFAGGHVLETWDITKGEEESRKLYSKLHSELICFDVCPKNGRVALGTRVGKSALGILMVLDSGKENAVVFEHPIPGRMSVTCGAFCPNGQYLATGSENHAITLWDVSLGAKRGERLTGHKDSLTSVAFSPDGKKIVSSSKDGTVRLWDVESGACVGISRRISSRVTSVSFTSDGERIVSGSHDGIVRVWDACLKKESKQRRSGHTEPVLDVSVSGNGLCLATASADGIVRLWDTHTGELNDFLMMGEDEQKWLNSMPIPRDTHTEEHVQLNEWLMAVQGFGEPAVLATFSSDGQMLVSCSSSGKLNMLNMMTGFQIGKTCTEFLKVRCASVSGDGLRITSASEHDILIWDARTLELTDMEGYDGRYSLSRVAESADGSHVVCQDMSQRTTIRNRETMKIVWDSEAILDFKESERCIPGDEAEKIIRSCGPHAQYLWPKCFSKYSDELYCEDGRVYSNLLEDKSMIAEARGPWAYNSKRKVLAFVSDSGHVAISHLAM